MGFKKRSPNGNILPNLVTLDALKAEGEGWTNEMSFHLVSRPILKLKLEDLDPSLQFVCFG